MTRRRNFGYQNSNVSTSVFCQMKNTQFHDCIVIATDTEQCQILIARFDRTGTDARLQLADHAQTLLGLEPQSVGRDAAGAPVWSGDLGGSFSHWREWSVCVIAKGAAADFGIDLEGIVDEATGAVIRAEALDAAEAKLIDQSPMPQFVAETLVFSAKESFFKAAFPRVGRVFGFDEVRLVAPLSADKLTLRVCRGLADLGPVFHVDVHCKIYDGFVLTWCAIPR